MQFEERERENVDYEDIYMQFKERESLTFIQHKKLDLSPPLSRENWRLVTDKLLEVRDFRRITDRFKAIYRRIYLK